MTEQLDEPLIRIEPEETSPLVDPEQPAQPRKSRSRKSTKRKSATEVDEDDNAPEEKKEPARRIFEINTVYDKGDRERRFLSNRITTKKYSCLSFLPKNLLVQFTKMANFYFLLLSVMELYKPISDSGGKPVMFMPLLFVVGVSMIKDAFEDYKRGA